MSKRYGRNQKRAAAAKIAKLEAALSGAERRLKMQDKIEAELIARMPEYSSALHLMAEEMGRALGDELLPHAQKLLGAMERSGPLFKLGVFSRPEFKCLEGQIPSLKYTVVVRG